MEQLGENVLELVRAGKREQAAHLVHELLFDVRRGARVVAGADALGLTYASWQLGLPTEAVQWARHVLQHDDDPERTARAQTFVVAGLYQLSRFGEALEAIRAAGNAPARVAPVSGCP